MKNGISWLEGRQWTRGKIPVRFLNFLTIRFSYDEINGYIVYGVFLKLITLTLVVSGGETFF